MKFHSFEKNIQERSNVCKFCEYYQKLDEDIHRIYWKIFFVIIFGVFWLVFGWSFFDPASQPEMINSSEFYLLIIIIGISSLILMGFALP